MKVQAALFKNERKNKETQPDYVGAGEIRTDENVDTGIKVEIAGWAKNSKKTGKAFLSLNVKWANDTKWQASTETAKPQPEQESLDITKADNLPF